MLQESHLEAPAAEHSRLLGAILPLGRIRWQAVRRPGGWKHITLEESDAFVWPMDERIIRKQVSIRCVHVGGNAAQEGARQGPQLHAPHEPSLPPDGGPSVGLGHRDPRGLGTLQVQPGR